VGPVCQASRVLLRGLVRRLSGADSARARLLLLAAEALCKGRGGLQVADRLALTADLKVARLPPAAPRGSPGGKGSPDPETLKRPRSDLSASILEQLTTPLAPSHLDETPSPSDDSETKTQLLRSNATALRSLNAADVVLDTCLNLTHLKPYLQRLIFLFTTLHAHLSTKEIKMPIIF
jgi:E3 ubiquitin-protein ligases UBR4 N-terminal